MGTKTADKLIALVSDMRDAQKQYFSTRQTSHLALAKGYEKAVDDLLEQIANEKKALNELPF